MDLVAALRALDKHTRLPLARVARRGGAEDLDPASVVLKRVQMLVPLRRSPSHDVVMAAGADLREVVGERQAAIDHDRGAAAPPGPLLEGRQHLLQGGAVLAITVEDFVGLRKPVAVQDQPDDDLLAVGAVIARVPALRLRIVWALAFEVG